MSKVSSPATNSLQPLSIKDKDKDITLEEDLRDRMSKVSSLADTSLQSLSLPLLPPCFTHQELTFLLRRQRKASLSMEDKTTILLLLTELACHGSSMPHFFTLLKINSLKARSSLLQLVADEWNWLLWSRMNTISSRKASKAVATVLHSVLSRCLAVLPADCSLRMGKYVGQFFRLYELKPLVTNVDGNTKEVPLIHKFLVRLPVKKETAADPDYHPDSMTDVESDSDPCSDVVLSPNSVKDEGAASDQMCPTLPKFSSGKSLMSREGKLTAERENAWQAMGFAAADRPSACLECWGCWRNKQCHEVAKWDRKQAAILKDKSASSPFLARARAAVTSTSEIAEELLSQDSLPSLNSLSPPLTEKVAGSQGTFPLVGSSTASSSFASSKPSSANPSFESSSPAKSCAGSPTVGFLKKFYPPSSPLGSSCPRISSTGCSPSRSSTLGSSPLDSPHPGISSIGCPIPRSSPSGSSPLGSPHSAGSPPSRSSQPISSPPGSSLRGSAPASAMFSHTGSPSLLAQNKVPMRTNIFEDFASTCQSTMLLSKGNASYTSAKAAPLVEININRKRPLDFSSAFTNMKKTKQGDEADLPCTCDDCRYVTAPHVGRMLVKGFLCRCHPCKLAREKKAADAVKV